MSPVLGGVGQLSIISTLLHKNLEKRFKELNDIFLIQTFDKVWHDWLLFKIYKTGLPNSIVEWTALFLEKRKFVVNIENELSESKTIKAVFQILNWLKRKRPTERGHYQKDQHPAVFLI